MKPFPPPAAEARGSAGAVRLEVHRSIHRVDPAAWDALAGPADIFHAHRFLCALEDGAVENAVYWYVLAWRDGQCVGTAVLSAFSISLDLFIGQDAWVRAAKRLWPKLFRVRLLFCGTPVSIGHRNLVAARTPADYAAIVPEVAALMRAICRTEKIRFSVFKEFFTADADALEPFLTRAGYFRAFSIPYVKLALHWPSFPGYLAAMRSGFRRQVLASLKKLGRVRTPVFVEDYFEEPFTENAPVWTIVPPEHCVPDEFFRRYESVMSRATVKLETLNAAFFREFYRHMGGDMKLLGLVYRGELLAVALLVAHGDELTFVWTGKLEARDDAHDNYFNLLTGMVAYAIAGGYRVLNLGQTAYYTKQRLGGEAEPLYIFFRAHQPWRHALLRALNAVIFPDMRLKALRVFGDRTNRNF